MTADRKTRLAVFNRDLGKRSLDAFLVTNETNVSYLSGFEGHDSFLLFARGKRFFITDSRYIEEAKSALKGFKAVRITSSIYETLEVLAKNERSKKIGFESMDLPYEVAVRLKKMMNRYELVPVKGLIESIRAVKDRQEIELIKKSARLTKIVLDKVIGRIKPGLSERSLAHELELEFMKSGGRASFDPIVAAGANSSKPHAMPTDAKITKDSLVMIDVGCKLSGYNSDYTRMIMLGKVKERIRKIYKVVHDAQKIALGLIRPGARISDIDRAARVHIQKQGFGKFFGHAVGHGVGMEVHEEPTISSANQGFLKPGMVFTVEPAIYIPKFGGVRIEDMVLVTDSGCEILTR